MQHLYSKSDISTGFICYNGCSEFVQVDPESQAMLPNKRREHITAGGPWKHKFSHVSSITQDLWGEPSQNPHLQGSAQFPKCPVLLSFLWSNIFNIPFPTQPTQACCCPLTIKLMCNSGLAVPCKSHIYHRKIEHNVTTRGLHQRTHPLSLALLHLYA